MASTRLTDLLLPTSFSDYVVALTKEKSALIRSGAAVENPSANSAINTGPGVFTLRQYQDVDGPDDLIPTDDPAASLIEGDYEAFAAWSMRGVVHPRVKPWSQQDFAVELNGSSPLQALANRIADAWARTHQAITISSLVGVVAAGEAATAGAYRYTADDGAAGNEILSESVIAATDLMGDAGTDLVALAVHSKVWNRLRQRNLIDFVPDSRGEVAFGQYLGLQLIVDDGLPVDTVATPDLYTSYLLGAGAVQTAIGTGQGLVPDEIDRDPESGNGGGRTNWYSRRRMVAHPIGFSYSGATDGDTPTTAQLQTAGNWSLAAPERKQIPIVELIGSAGLIG